MDQTIPYGYCQCGCGGKAPLATCSNRSKGYVKGQPVRFIHGHHARLSRVEGDGPNPSGLCQCGCGRRTPSATSTNRRTGRIKGKSLPFVPGHRDRGRQRGHAPNWELDFTTGCWVWRGNRSRGYGIVTTGRRAQEPAHRHFYKEAVGPIPEGFHLHHDCGNKLCVNPDHLIPLSPDDHARIHAI